MEKVRVDKEHKVRLRMLALLVVMMLIVIIGRLFSIQVLQHDKYAREADIQQKLKVDIEADRGQILDRQGVALAISRDRYSLYLNTEKCDNVRAIASSLAGVLGRSAQSIEKAARQSRGNVLIERKISRQKKMEVEKLNIRAVSFDVEKERYYPSDDLASQIIGYAGVDNEGLEGIEGSCDELLAGVDGTAILQRDGRGGKLVNPDFPCVPPRSGKDILLTIDAEFQEMAEDALDRAIERCGARSGSVVVVVPYRGEILALACYPRADLNTVSKIRNRGELYSAMRNRVITDSFEPGSSFKIVTLTSALERGVANLDERIFCENGSYLVSNHLFHDIHKYGWLKVREVIERSSNIGTIKLAERVEKEGLYQMARRYGFGIRTGIDFPGEAAGVLGRLDQWSGISLASIAIGQEVSVTALQMVMAYAAIANGGLLMKPILVKEVWDNNGDVIYEAQPEVIREVMSRETAERVKEVLVGVVERGTGRKSRISGFQIAGKTGTAQKSMPGQAGYTRGKYVTTFGGFFPAQNTRYAIFIALDEPKEHKWGGESAAPLCRDLIESAIFADNGFLSESPAYLVNNAPGNKDRYEVIRATHEVSDTERKRNEDEEESHIYNLVFPGTDAHGNGDRSYPFVKSSTAGVRMPDVSGMSIREAFKTLSRDGFKVRARGVGRVVKQNPVAGTNCSGEDICLLWGERL